MWPRPGLGPSPGRQRRLGQGRLRRRQGLRPRGENGLRAHGRTGRLQVGSRRGIVRGAGLRGLACRGRLCRLGLSASSGCRRLADLGRFLRHRLAIGRLDIALLRFARLHLRLGRDAGCWKLHRHAGFDADGRGFATRAGLTVGLHQRCRGRQDCGRNRLSGCPRLAGRHDRLPLRLALRCGRTVRLGLLATLERQRQELGRDARNRHGLRHDARNGLFLGRVFADHGRPIERSLVLFARLASGRLFASSRLGLIALGGRSILRRCLVRSGLRLRLAGRLGSACRFPVLAGLVGTGGRFGLGRGRPAGAVIRFRGLACLRAVARAAVILDARTRPLHRLRRQGEGLLGLAALRAAAARSCNLGQRGRTRDRRGGHGILSGTEP